MSTLLVARKEFQDALRSRTLVIVAGLFTAFLAFYIYFTFAMQTPGQPAEVADLYLAVASVVAVVGTLLGYNTIVSERASGSLKVLLGAPLTRRDIVVGKFLGRAAVVAVTVFIGFAVVVAHYAVLVESSPAFTAYARLGSKMVVLGVVFVAIAIAFSAALRSTTVATWGAIGLAILFAFVWDTVLLMIEASVVPPESSVPNWLALFRRLDPKYAFMTVSGPAPFYLDPWFGIVILGGWIVVPLGLGYLRFERGDLA
jgi:ABC-2 type transport system permease protein